jgi:hypothetical protein
MGRVGRALLGCALAATSVALFAPAAAPAAKSLGTFKVLDGKYTQEMFMSTMHSWDDGCWKQYLFITAQGLHYLKAVRGTKVRAEPSYFDSITLDGIKFTGEGDESVNQGEPISEGPSDPENCPSSPDPVGWDTSTCGFEKVDPPTELELTEAGTAPTTESFFSPGRGLAPFGPLTDPDGNSSLCYTGSDWAGVTYPAPSKTKRGKLLRAEKPIKITGHTDVTVDGPTGLSDCFCDSNDGYQDIEVDWSLKLKPVGKG